MSSSKFDLKNPKVRNPLMVALVGIAAIALWWYQFYVPVKQEITALTGRLEQKRDTLNTILALKPQLEVLRKEIAVAQVKLDSLKSIFPDQKEVPKLIREITGIARASGISTTKFNPLEDIEREYFVENKYNIAVAGGYHQLGEFFSFLANFPLIINLDRVTIAFNGDFERQRKEADELGLTPASVVASFEMTTFSSKR